MRKPILAFACSLRSRVKVLLDLRSSGSPNVESQASNYGGKRSEIRIVKQDLFELLQGRLVRRFARRRSPVGVEHQQFIHRFINRRGVRQPGAHLAPELGLSGAMLDARGKIGRVVHPEMKAVDPVRNLLSHATDIAADDGPAGGERLLNNQG